MKIEENPFVLEILSLQESPRLIYLAIAHTETKIYTKSANFINNITYILNIYKASIFYVVQEVEFKHDRGRVLLYK